MKIVSSLWGVCIWSRCGERPEWNWSLLVLWQLCTRAVTFFCRSGSPLALFDQLKRFGHLKLLAFVAKW